MAKIRGAEPVLATLRWQLADGTPYNERIQSSSRIMVFNGQTLALVETADTGRSRNRSAGRPFRAREAFPEFAIR